MSRIEKNMIDINYFFVPVVYIYRHRFIHLFSSSIN